MSYFVSLTENFVLTWDVGIIAFLFLGAFFYGFSVGARKLGSFLVSVYFGYVLFQLFPYIERFANNMPDYRKAIVEGVIFGAFIFGIFFITVGSVIGSSLGLPKKDENQMWQLLILAIVSAGLFTASALAFFPESYYDRLSTITREGFISHNAHFWWAVIGIAALAIMRKTTKQS